MKNTIKVNYKNTLTQEQLDKLIESGAINLSGKKSTKQVIKNKLKKQLYASLFTLFIILGANIHLYHTNALEVEINESKEIILQEDLDNLVEKIQESVDQEEIIVDNSKEIEESDKAYNEFMIEQERLHKIKYQEQEFNTRLFNFVAKGEGAFQPKAFCDSYYKTKTGLVRKSPKHCTRWSVGFGTLSYEGEIITYEEGVKRRNADILKRMDLITSDCLTANQKIATIDFMYQHGNNSSKVKYNANNCNSKEIYDTIVNWRDLYKSKKQGGMVKREQLRINLFYTL